MTDDLLKPFHCVGLNLYKTARAVSRVYAEEMRPAGLARSQFAILGTLERSGPVSLSTLAEGLYMDRTTLTRNLKPLEKAGLAVRRRSETDARVMLVEITGSGSRRFREALKYWRRAQRRMLELLGENEWQALESKLMTVRELAAGETS